MTFNTEVDGAALGLVSLGAETQEQSLERIRQELADDFSFRKNPIWMTVRTASVAAGAYHGYKRNQSVGWAVAWAFLGFWFPIVTNAVAVAQGFAKPAKKK